MNTILKLKKNEDRRLKNGHLWVYSNEVDVAKTPLTAFAAGDQVTLVAHDGQTLGSAYVNPHSLIAARLISRDETDLLTLQLITQRMKIAQIWREKRYGKEPANAYYRWVFGESDGLPGLIIDRYGSTAVVSTTTAGMDRFLDEIITLLQTQFGLTGVIVRNDVAVRALEGLPENIARFGDIPDYLSVIENGVTFSVPTEQGQKTGWFYDQRDNRDRVAPYAHQARVLDVFSYVGGWSLRMLAAGASRATALDSSAPALACATRNAQANQMADRFDTIQGDAFDQLKILREAREKYDLIIVDPPAFAKRKKDLIAGLDAYRRINQLAMTLLSRHGVLVSCSCSQAVSSEALLKVLYQAARHVDRRASVVMELNQACDHPTLPAMPETRYLKGYVLTLSQG